MAVAFCHGGKALGAIKLHSNLRVQPKATPKLAGNKLVKMSAPIWLADIDKSYLEKALGCPVTKYDIKSPRELEQSEVAVISVITRQAGTGITNEQELLLKRYHMKRLMQRISKTEEKWRISASSFINEFHFLEHKETVDALNAADAHIPRTLYASAQLGDLGADYFDRQYDFLLEYLPEDNFLQANQLTLEQALAALSFLARFHAFFWASAPAVSGGAPKGSATAHDATDRSSTSSSCTDRAAATSNTVRDTPSSHAQLRQGLFKRGAWWRKELRPSVKYNRIPAAFQGLCQAFPDAHLFGPLDSPDSHALMHFLADRVDWINSSISSAPDRTLVHGDFKTSNIFFTTTTSKLSATPQTCSDSAAPPSTDGIVAYAIDFQWTGNAPSGLADVVYLLHGGVRYEVLHEHEEYLLQHYYSELTSALSEAGHPAEAYSRTNFEADLKLESLAYFITALPQLLDGLTPEVALENDGKYGWLTHEMDPRVTAWMCRRALGLAGELRKRGSFHH